MVENELLLLDLNIWLLACWFSSLGHGVGVLAQGRRYSCSFQGYSLWVVWIGGK